MPNLRQQQLCWTVGGVAVVVVDASAVAVSAVDDDEGGAAVVVAIVVVVGCDGDRYFHPYYCESNREMSPEH